MSFEHQYTPPSDRRSNVLMITTVTTALLLVVGAAVAGVIVLVGFDGFGGGDDDGPSYPKEWDVKVYAFAKYVEQERDLEFKHPVHVEFLTEADFKKQVTSKEEDLSDEDKKEIEQFTGLFRAAGLMEGEVDLFESMNDLSGGGTIGLYNHKDKKIRLRGTELTVSVRKTLVHELVHALQDQHFDLEKRTKEFEEDEDSDGASSAYDALVEGDASRIEDTWEAALSKADRAQLRKEQKAEGESFDKDTADVPEVLVTFTAAPYVLGDRMLGIAHAIDGNDKVDALFRDPPSSEEHLLDPWSFLEDDDEVADVDEPGTRKGEKEFDSGTFGAFTWYLMLAERLDLVAAHDAALGWGGDAYVAFERDDRTCFRAAWEGDGPRDVGEMEDALRAWVAALPGGPAKVERDGATLTFESCDPGKDARIGKDRPNAALGYALALPDISMDVYGDTKNVALSRCFAVGVMHALTPAQLRSTDPKLLQRPAIQRKLQAVGQQCR